MVLLVPQAQAEVQEVVDQVVAALQQVLLVQEVAVVVVDLQDLQVLLHHQDQVVLQEHLALAQVQEHLAQVEVAELVD
jgi:hypothetical protein